MTQRAGFSAVLFLVTVAFVVFASETWPETLKPKDPGLGAMARIAALRTSAVLGRAEAQFELAECYSNGKDVERDVNLARLRQTPTR